jgi:dihydroflavonol-4-reductase
MRVCVTGATGFVGGHVARLLAERGDEVRVTYRNPDRLDRLADLDVRPVKADVLDRSALRRAFRDAELVFHTAGYVGSSPRARVWSLNALSPRIAVEAAAAAGVERLVLTSSVAALGPAPPGEVAHESQLYAGQARGLIYPDAKHEGEMEALVTGGRAGVDVVVVNPSYVFGVPVDRSQPGETSTRTIGNYLRGRLPGVVDGALNGVDVEDVATGHLLAAERGTPGERYVLGGENLTWVELLERVAKLSDVHHPVVVLPPGLATVARAREALGLPGPIAAEGYQLMGANWRVSSRKAERELGYRSRPLDDTLRATIAWYKGLISAGVFDGDRPSTLSALASSLRLASRLGATGALRLGERLAGRRLVAHT